MNCPCRNERVDVYRVVHIQWPEIRVQTAKEELMHWKAKVCAVEHIEELASELEIVTVAELEEFIHCQIDGSDARGT